MPPACGRERWYAVPRGVRDLRFERADYRTSDLRLAWCLGTYSPFTVGHMVQGDFSTPLRCGRNDRRGAQTGRGDLRKEVWDLREL